MNPSSHAAKGPPDRVPHLDTAKAVGIFLIYAMHFAERLHLAGAPEAFPVMKFAFSFAVPFFFFLAGAFWKPERGEPDFLAARLRTRIVPVLFFCAATLPFWFLESPTSREVWVKAARLAGGAPVLNLVMWFVICLFTVETGLSLIRKTFIRPRVVTAIAWLLFFYTAGWLAGAYAGPIAEWTGVRKNFWYVNEAFMAAFFYVAGYLTRTQIFMERRVLRDALLAVAGLAVAGMTFDWNAGPFSTKQPFVNMAASSHGHPLWFLVTACAGTVGTFALCRLLPAWGCFRFVGRTTLIYLGLNGFCYHFLDVRMMRWLPGLPQTVGGTAALAAGYAAVMLIIFAPLVWALRRWVPWAAGMAGSPAPAGSRTS